MSELRIVGVGTWWLVMRERHVVGQFKSKGRAEDWIREQESLAKALDECPTCQGQRTIAIAGPDENGMYDTDDCPTCSAAVVPRPGYCKHGVYVGGIGVDWMCGRCEDGA